MKNLFVKKKFCFFSLYFILLFLSTIYIFLKFFYWKNDFKDWEIIIFFFFCVIFILVIIFLFYLEYKKQPDPRSIFNLDNLSQILNAQKTILLIFDPVTEKMIWTNESSFFSNFFLIKKYHQLPLSEFLPAIICQKIQKKENFSLHKVFFRNKKKQKERFLLSFLFNNMLVLQNEKAQTNLEDIFTKNQLIFFLLEIDSGDFILDPNNLLDQKSPQIWAFVGLRLSEVLNDYKGWLTNAKPGCFVMILNNEGFQKLKKDKFDFIKKLTDDIYSKFKIRLSFSGGAYDDYKDLFDDDKFNSYNFSIIHSYQQSLQALKTSQARLGNQVTLIDNAAKTKFFGEQVIKQGSPVRYIDKDYWRFLDLINKYKNIFIVGHIEADFDVFGAGLAIKFFLENVFSDKKNVYFVVQKAETDTEKEVRQILKNNQQKYDELIRSNFLFLRKDKTPATKNALILIDTNKPKIMDISSLQMEKMRGIFILDHHIDNFLLRSTAFKLINANFSSTSEIVTLFLALYEQQGKSLSFPQAIFHLLMLGILVDTNNLQNNIGRQTIKSINFLVQKGINLSQVIDQMNSYKDTFIAQKIESIFVQPHKVILKVFDKSIHKNMAAIFAEDYLLKKNVHVIFVVLFDNTGTIFVSARSKIKFNVGKICKQLGGGGGYDRAAAKINGYTADVVINKITDFIQKE